MHVLLVVDDSRARQSIARLLAKLGHTAIIAPSPQDGLRRLEREPFDAVLVALPTPRGESMKLLKTSQRRWPDTRLFVLPGTAEAEDAARSLEIETVPTRKRPIDRVRLGAVLDQLVSGGPLPPDAAPSTPESPARDLGEGRLEPMATEGRVQKVLRIDATGAPPNMLARLLVGSYITGQDQVLITARHGLTEAQRSEIHRLVDRTLGMSVVGDSPEVVEIQNFIDPGKHELPRLLHRVVQMLRAELEACRAALEGKESPQLPYLDAIEEEVDRFYLLMVRQLLLSSDNPRIARNIDVESHHYQIGYRLVAKVLEVTGDLIHGVGTELQGNLAALRRLPRPVANHLVERVDRADDLLARTMEAFDRLSVTDANATLNAIGEVLPRDANLGQEICRTLPNRKVAVAAQRIVYNLDMVLEMLIIINETTINRGVEPETVARTGSRVPMGRPSSEQVSRPSRPASPSEVPVTRRAPRSKG